jgi:hypothetical protein
MTDATQSREAVEALAADLDELGVDSVLDVNRRLDRSVSCPLCGGSDVGRRETLRVVLTNK